MSILTDKEISMLHSFIVNSMISAPKKWTINGRRHEPRPHVEMRPICVLFCVLYCYGDSEWVIIEVDNISVSEHTKDSNLVKQLKEGCEAIEDYYAEKTMVRESGIVKKALRKLGVL